MIGWLPAVTGWLGRIALAAGAAVLALWQARRIGEQTGRAEARTQSLETVTDVQRRMLDAAGDRPGDRDSLVERMRGGRF